jgi:quaternary ammonium compound-resistance protein SugE
LFILSSDYLIILEDLVHWFYLVGAGLLEILWAVGLKYTEGFTRLIPSIFTISSMAVSFWLLSLSLDVLPIGTAYAVWTGIGTAGTVIYGMIWLGEPTHYIRILCIGFILLGILGLKIQS